MKKGGETHEGSLLLLIAGNTHPGFVRLENRAFTGRPSSEWESRFPPGIGPPLRSRGCIFQWWQPQFPIGAGRQKFAVNLAPYGAQCAAGDRAVRRKAQPAGRRIVVYLHSFGRGRIGFPIDGAHVVVAAVLVKTEAQPQIKKLTGQPVDPVIAAVAFHHSPGSPAVGGRAPYPHHGKRPLLYTQNIHFLHSFHLYRKGQGTIEGERRKSRFRPAQLNRRDSVQPLKRRRERIGGLIAIFQGDVKNALAGVHQVKRCTGQFSPAHIFRKGNGRDLGKHGLKNRVRAGNQPADLLFPDLILQMILHIRHHRIQSCNGIHILCLLSLSV